MKQAFNSKNGVVCHEVPEPALGQKHILVDVQFSCISAGTEMSSVNNAQKNLIKRAMENPGKLVPMAMDVLKNRGAKALLMVAKTATGGNFGKPLGYTAAGIVRQVGADCSNFSVGDRVAVAGAGYANHAGVVSVPQNLAAKIPEGVSFEEAATVAVGCIAMQGVRRMEAIAGETIVVMGLGILGMLGFQMLKAQGCTVIGIDINSQRLKEAKELGCDVVINSKEVDAVQQVAMITEGRGSDGVLFTAATMSNDPMSDCFKMLRRKGRFVLVGVSGMHIKREDIYSKEIDFRMATSYGAGRYDEDYESRGLDYPREWVRWTENRNMQTYMQMIARKQINVKSLIDAIFEIDQAGDAYKSLKKPERPLIVLLKYGNLQKEEPKRWEIPKDKVRMRQAHAINYAVIGAGSFVRSMHLPNLEKMQDKFHLEAVMNRTGSSAAFLANLYGASYYTTDVNEILDDPSIEMVMICTRHDLHAEYAIRALQKGKAVFVEKPAAIAYDEAERLFRTIRETGRPYFVGFNRRFSDYLTEVRRVLQGRTEKLQILYTMNAGYLPVNSWTHGPTGGGRIVGEGCHIIDAISSVVQSPIIDMHVSALRDDGGYYDSSDNVSVSFCFEDGSEATMLYIANGSKKYPKETMNIWMGNKHIHMNDYTDLTAEGVSIRHIKNSAPSKGHAQEMEAFYKAIREGNGYPIPVDDIEQTTMASLKIRALAASAAAETRG